MKTTMKMNKQEEKEVRPGRYEAPRNMVENEAGLENSSLAKLVSFGKQLVSVDNEDIDNEKVDWRLD